MWPKGTDTRALWRGTLGYLPHWRTAISKIIGVWEQNTRSVRIILKYFIIELKISKIILTCEIPKFLRINIERKTKSDNEKKMNMEVCNNTEMSWKMTLNISLIVVVYSMWWIRTIPMSLVHNWWRQPIAIIQIETIKQITIDDIS